MDNLPVSKSRVAEQYILFRPAVQTEIVQKAEAPERPGTSKRNPWSRSFAQERRFFASFSATRAFTSLVTSALGSGLSAAKRMLPFEVS